MHTALMATESVQYVRDRLQWNPAWFKMFLDQSQRAHVIVKSSLRLYVEAPTFTVNMLEMSGSASLHNLSKNRGVMLVMQLYFSPLNSVSLKALLRL